MEIAKLTEVSYTIKSIYYVKVEILTNYFKIEKKKEEEEEKEKNIMLSFNVKLCCLLFHNNSDGRNKTIILDSAHEFIGQFRYIHFL